MCFCFSARTRFLLNLQPLLFFFQTGFGFRTTKRFSFRTTLDGFRLLPRRFGKPVRLLFRAGASFQLRLQARFLFLQTRFKFGTTTGFFLGTLTSLFGEAMRFRFRLRSSFLFRFKPRRFCFQLRFNFGTTASLLFSLLSNFFGNSLGFFFGARFLFVQTRFRFGASLNLGLDAISLLFFRLAQRKNLGANSLFLLGAAHGFLLRPGLHGLQLSQTTLFLFSLLGALKSQLLFFSGATARLGELLFFGTAVRFSLSLLAFDFNQPALGFRLLAFKFHLPANFLFGSHTLLGFDEQSRFGLSMLASGFQFSATTRQLRRDLHQGFLLET